MRSKNLIRSVGGDGGGLGWSWGGGLASDSWFSVVSSLSAKHAPLGTGSWGGGSWSDSVVTGGEGVLLVVVSDVSGSGRVLARRELESREVLLGQEPKVDEEEDWLGEEVEDTVGDHLRVGSDDVSTIGDTPDDGVDEPEDREDGAGDDE